jgi:hypothetical protein
MDQKIREKFQGCYLFFSGLVERKKLAMQRDRGTDIAGSFRHTGFQDLGPKFGSEACRVYFSVTDKIPYHQ